MGCWYDETGSNTVLAADFDENCAKTGDKKRFSSWIQHQQEIVAIPAAAAKRLAFDQSVMAVDTRAITYKNENAQDKGKYDSGAHAHISDFQIREAAEALASIWI